MEQLLSLLSGNVDAQPMWVAILMFAVGFVCLIKGGDWFVDGAESIAHRFHMPELLIGATVVAIGTTLPEVMVSAGGAISALQGNEANSSIAFGNAIGSVICNTALISSITLIVKPAKVDRKTFLLPSAAFFIAAAYYVITAYLFGSFSRISGVTLLVMFVIYMVVTVVQMKRQSGALKAQAPAQAEDGGEGSVGRDILLLVIGAAVIALGARYLVNSATVVATALGVPESVIALTLVALGTSLPELVTAITALAKGHGALSLGNIIGANLFNLVLVSGTAFTICPIDLSSASATSMTVDIPLMLGVMAVLTLPALLVQKLPRWQGAVLLASYVAYCVFLFASGAAV